MRNGEGADRKEGQGNLAQRIDRVTELPMLILALAYVVTFLFEYIPDISPDVRSGAELSEYIIVAIFAAELVVKVAVADNRLAYLRAHWLDVLIVVVPFLRPLRVLRVLRLIPFLIRCLVGIERILGHYKGAYALTAGLLSVFISAALMAEFERGAGGPITNFGDALWWAITTVTTVGYGDMVPVTAEGKAVAVFLMLVGISLFGVLTAGIAAYFVESAAQTKERRAEAKELLQTLRRLEARIEEQSQALATLRTQRDGRERES